MTTAGGCRWPPCRGKLRVLETVRACNNQGRSFIYKVMHAAFDSTQLTITWRLFLCFAFSGIAPVSRTVAAETPSQQVTPGPKQKALFEKLCVAEAWRLTRGSTNVIVGVVDTGFDFFHPALEGRMEPGFYYPGGYHSEDYPSLAHGTIVASLIVAWKPGDDSMIGLAPGCRVLTASQGALVNPMAKLQVEYFGKHPNASITEFQAEIGKHKETLTRFGKKWSEYQVGGAADAILYFVDNGARVINISGLLRRSVCQSEEAWTKLERAFAYAAGKNAIIVLGAGNDAVRVDDYPGESRFVIVVGATLLNDQRWEENRSQSGITIKQGSNYGPRLTCMAPSESLWVCMPHAQRMYETQDGPAGATKIPFTGAYNLRANGATSCATPIVTALAALIVSSRPDFDAETVVRLIRQGCNDIGEPGYDQFTGHGRVNYAATLRLALGESKR